MAVHDERSFQQSIACELVATGGWVQRPHGDVERGTRLITDDLIGHLRDTQPAALDNLASVSGPSAFDAKFMESVIDAMEHNSDLDKRMHDDAPFAEIVKEWMLARVHRHAAECHDKPELDLP